jgi:dGTPase
MKRQQPRQRPAPDTERIGRCAVTERNSRGRSFPEKPHPYRSAFERDRDRIIHCTAFRRLEGKTQVVALGFGNGDDHYRTRMTHTIEVAQIGRTIARALGLNESLTEAVCLAHDIGHCPFGHTGESVLDDLMAGFGGFEHNIQALRIVDMLEHPYPGFPGLNLMYETRLDLLKGRQKGVLKGQTELNCSLEGQVADAADRIAYNCHDLEDGMFAGLIREERLEDLLLFRRAKTRVNAAAIEDATVRRTRIAKDMIDGLVSDCIASSAANMEKLDIKSLGDVYATPQTIVALSPESEDCLAALERFLERDFYGDSSLRQPAEKIDQWLRELFAALCRSEEIMPPFYRQLAAREGLERTVCDYIAGMTDRFCLKMLRKLCPGEIRE